MAVLESDETVTGTGRSSFAGRLKTDFLKKWDDHVHKKTPIVSKVAQKKGTMGGKESLGSVATALPQSAGVALMEGHSLPTPDAGTYIQPYLHARDLYMRLRWSGQVERAARRGDKHAWAQPRKEDIKNGTSQFMINFARMLYLGRYQLLGEVSTGSATNPTLYGRDARTSAAADFWKFGTHYLRVGMEIDWVTSVTGTGVNDGTPHTITAIDNSTPSAPTITYTDAGTDVTADDWIIPFDSRGSTITSANNSSEFSGVSGVLEYASDLNTYAAVYDIARAAGDTISGVHNTNSGTTRAFDENLIALVVDQVVDNGVGDSPDYLCMHSSVRREYVKQTAGDRRFAPTQDVKGYSAKLMFNAGDSELPLMVDRDCPPGMAIVLNSKDWGWLSQSDMGSPDSTGERFVADQDAREVVMHKSGNCFCETPFNNGIIDDITYDVDALT
jgi:hypothetical protein